MNEVSIIINGVRYDAIELSHNDACRECDICDILEMINEENYIECICGKFNFWYNVCFKKSDKKFER